MSENEDFARGLDLEQDGQKTTYVVLSYNQEKFIEKAVDSALQQVCPRLQVVISDDCSTDRTFDLIRKKVEAYAGPHQVKLNRNPANLGLVAHVNHVMSMVDGEIIIAAAGDDISVKDRALEIIGRFRSGGENIQAVCSAVKVIDDEEAVIGRMAGVREVSAEQALTSKNRWMIGCSQAWRKSIFEVFGPIPANAWAEDKIIAFRALLLGRIGFVDKELVFYRQHVKSITATHDDASRSLQAISTLRSHQEDVRTLKKITHGREQELMAIEGKLDLLIRENELYLAMARARVWCCVWIWLVNIRLLSIKKCLKLIAHKFEVASTKDQS